MSTTDSRAKILCVDDDHGQRLLLSFLLERQGLEVRTAGDGFQATQTLRADPRTADIPVLALTAYGEEKMQARAKSVGINGFVLKTILPADLLDTLREYIPSLK
jgi:CheY-like chemotaxis protein